jgi:hypothetical protein
MKPKRATTQNNSSNVGPGLTSFSRGLLKSQGAQQGSQWVTKHSFLERCTCPIVGPERSQERRLQATCAFWALMPCWHGPPPWWCWPPPWHPLVMASQELWLGRDADFKNPAWHTWHSQTQPRCLGSLLSKPVGLSLPLKGLQLKI